MRITPFLIVPALLVAACTQKETAQIETAIGRENINTIMVTDNKVEHPEHGLETWFAVGAMNGANDVGANGMGQSHVFQDGSTIASINLNILEAPKGFVFVGWLSKTGSPERVRLGALVNPLNDARHQVIADLEKDLSGYMSLTVTQEPQSGPTESDLVVAEGIMKERHR